MRYGLLEDQRNLTQIGKNIFIRIRFFKIHADFEAHNDIDNSSVGDKTINNYKLNPVLNGFHIISVVEVGAEGGVDDPMY